MPFGHGAAGSTGSQPSLPSCTKPAPHSPGAMPAARHVPSAVTSSPAGHAHTPSPASLGPPAAELDAAPPVPDPPEPAPPSPSSPPPQPASPPVNRSATATATGSVGRTVTARSYHHRARGRKRLSF